MQTLSESIQKVINQLGDKQKDKRMLLFAQWPQIVGNLLAKHSCPADLVEKILVVNVSNSAFMYMLRLKQAQILHKINKLTDQDIREIKLRIGKID